MQTFLHPSPQRIPILYFSHSSLQIKSMPCLLPHAICLVSLRRFLSHLLASHPYHICCFMLSLSISSLSPCHLSSQLARSPLVHFATSAIKVHTMLQVRSSICQRPLSWSKFFLLDLHCYHWFIPCWHSTAVHFIRQQQHQHWSLLPDSSLNPFTAQHRIYCSSSFDDSASIAWF